MTSVSIHILRKVFILMFFCDGLKTMISSDVSRHNILRRSRQKRFITFEGVPYLSNCMSDKSKAKEQAFLIKNGVKLTPRWTNEDEYVRNPDLPDRYDYDYDAERATVNPDTEEIGSSQSFDILKYKLPNSGKILFPPFSAPPGFYTVRVRMVLKRQSTIYELKVPADHDCYFYVKVLPPLVVIDIGTYRAVPPNTNVTLSGSQSLDPNKPLNNYNVKSMKFSWNCTQKATPSTVCSQNPISTEVDLFIPAHKVVTDEVFNITLFVKTDLESSGTAYHTITVVPKVAMLKIWCAKNCPPATDTPNAQSVTFFRAVCEQNCERIAREDYQWTIEKLQGIFDFDYAKNTHFGRRGPKFVISKNVLEAATEYKITLKLKPNAKRQGYVTMNVKYSRAPTVDSCEIRPVTGVSLETRFKLSCVETPPPDRNNFYELYGDPLGAEMFINGFYPDVFEGQFYLPPSEGRSFTVRVSKNGGPAIFLSVKPRVVSMTDGKTSAEALEIYKKFYNGTPESSMSDLITSRDKDKKQKGIDMFQALVNDIVVSKISTNATDNFIKKLTHQIVQDVLTSVTDKVPDLIKMSDSLTRLIERGAFTKMDLLLAKMTTTICKMMVDKHTESLKKDKFPTESEKETDVVDRKCLEENVKEDHDLLAPIEHNIAIIDLPVRPLESYVEENYENYVDFDDEYIHKLDDFQEITHNIIDATFVAAKAMALTMAVGEHFATRSGKHSATIVAKDEGQELVNTRVQLLDIVLLMSRDFENSSHAFDILMSVWKRDLMWWNHAKTRVATNLVGVQFWHSTCKKRIRHFKNPVNILLTIKNTTNFDIEMVEGNVSAPGDYADKPTEDINPYIRVHRMLFPKHSIIYIDFHNISQSAVLDVVTTSFQFPTIDDFETKQVVSSVNNSFMQIVNYEGYDKWGYLALLPNKESRGGVLHYNVSFTLTYCIRWIEKNRAWEIDCKSSKGSNRSVIVCDCRHFSVIAGYIQNCESIVQEVFTIDIVLELQKTYLIFITLAVTFGIFCLLLLLVVFRKKNEIYYLADNNRSHRYAYLVVVRTENTGTAGTTSDVILRLSGEKKRTKPHVLNYPDPQYRLLQSQGHDIFVLTTRRHLGEINKIELWFDSIGPSPAWYCRDMVVYDMQTHAQWYFRIRTRFSLRKGGVSYLALEPTEKEPRGFSNQFRVCNHFHTWQLWARETNFIYAARLTVVFSNILMIYVLVLIMVGVPSLTLKDCFDYENYKLQFSMIPIAALCSFIAFFVHIVIAWIFRFSHIGYTVRDKRYEHSHNRKAPCWVLLSLLITASTAFLLIFGFWVPLHMSQFWLTCCFIGFVLTVVIYENLFILVQTSLCKFRLVISFDKNYDNIIRNIEAQREYLYTKFHESLLRPLLQHLYVPMTRVQLNRQRIIVKLRREIFNDLLDLLLYGVYNILLYIIVLLNQGALTVVGKSELESMVEGEHTRTLAFSKIDSMKQMYEYINDTLIPTLHPLLWYGNFSFAEKGRTIDNANKIIGTVRLRQHRMTAKECTIAEPMKFLNMSCLSKFSFSNAETKDFGPEWTKQQPGALFDRLSSIWKYSSEEETETWLTIGIINSYSGGGYVAFLGRTLYNSYANLFKFWKLQWIDGKTRSFFIEFLTYNANYNIFVAVRLLTEHSATGYISNSEEIKVVRMLFVANELEEVFAIFFWMFVIWVMMLNIKLLVGIVKYYLTIHKRVWLMIDLVINVLSLICIGMYVVRVQMVERYLTSLEAVKHNEFVSYFSLLYVQDFLTYFAAFLVCIATARLWRFLRFGLFFRIMERTLSMAAAPLLGVTFAFTVLLTAFALTGILIFKGEFPEMAFFLKSMSTLIQLSLKPDQFDLTVYTVFQVAYPYFTVYLLTMQVVLLVYITVIIMAYVKAQLELSVPSDSYTVSDYFHEHAHYVPILLKNNIRRLRGGEKDKSPVTAKADEFRYANSIGIQRRRLKSMQFIVSCIIKNVNQTHDARKQLTEHETSLMLGVCRTFVLKPLENDDYDLFFKGHFEGAKVKLIDEGRIDKSAQCVRLMFPEESGEPSEEKIQKPDSRVMRCSKMAKEKIEMLKRCSLTLMLISLKFDKVELGFNELLQE